MKNNIIYSRCDDYNAKNVEAALSFIFENFEGLEDKIKSAKKILVKPNLLTARPPEHAVTTHPQVLISLIQKIRSLGAEVLIADTPVGPLNKSVMEKIYSTCQMNQVAESTGCKLNWDFSETTANISDAKILKSTKILKVADEADLIINCAKLKTHSFTMITCATKNHFGIVPGLLKVKCHLTLSQVDMFTNMLLDIERYFDHKTVHLIDGVVGMEGFGPSNGTPFPAKCILAGNDAVYLDILACHIMGAEPDKIPIISEAYNRGIIEYTQFNKLEVKANDTIQTYKFKLPPERKSVLPGFVPKWVTPAINNMLISKPVFSAERCIGCKICEESCPPQVIKVNNNIASVDDYSKCIRCYCCQESCPQNAIELKKPFIGQVLSFFKLT